MDEDINSAQELTPEAIRMYDLIPENGKSVGNVSLRKAFGDDANYSSVRQELLDATWIVLGRGKGGSVKRVFVPEIGA